MHDVKINSFVSLRLALGYNAKRFFGGMTFVAQSRAVRFEDIQLTSATSTFKFLLGYRFKEFGLLTKSVWDIPKNIYQRLN